MEFIEKLKTDVNFRNQQPIPMVLIEDFLPIELAINLHKESLTIDNSFWTKFNRNGSHMKECKNLSVAPIAFDLVSKLHSSVFLTWLEKITGIAGIIPDPYLTGAGYCKSYRGDVLKKHTDFNWNEQLKLHRVLSLIIYLTPEWDPSWGGSLDFYDKTGDNIIKSNPCLFNNCLIWEYDKYGYHGYETPLNCPNTIQRTAFRLFFYKSNSSHNETDPPHRSLYWINESKQPYDKRDHK